MSEGLGKGGGRAQTDLIFTLPVLAFAVRWSLGGTRH